jgi:hypothetical protein
MAADEIVRFSSTEELAGSSGRVVSRRVSGPLAENPYLAA